MALHKFRNASFDTCRYVRLSIVSIYIIRGVTQGSAKKETGMRKLLVILLLLSFGVSFAAEQHAPRRPIIVAKRSFIDQAGDIATTTIFRVRRDGLYRISSYATATGCCIPAFHLFWTDESGAETAGEGPTISAFPPITALGSQGSNCYALSCGDQDSAKRCGGPRAGKLQCFRHSRDAMNFAEEDPLAITGVENDKIRPSCRAKHESPPPPWRNFGTR